MNGGVAFVSAVIGIVAVWFYFRHKKNSKVTIILFALFGLLGVGSFWVGISSAIHNSEISMARGIGGSAASGAGAGILAGLGVIVCLEVFWKALHRTGQPKSWHPWIALIMGTVLATSGITVATDLVDTLSNITTQVGNDTMGGATTPGR